MNQTESMEALNARQTIAELIYRYCRSVDRLDPNLGYTIWHDDAVADYGDFYRGDGPGVIDLICEQHRHLLYHSHEVSNIIIDIEGDRAGSEAYVTANLRMKQGEQIRQMTVWSRYIDQWSRRSGRWAIDKRIAVRDFDEIRDVVPLSSLTSEGSRDTSDPSYNVLRDPHFSVPAPPREGRGEGEDI